MARPNEENTRTIFLCRYCSKEFPSARALGGHQNAHKQERALEKSQKLYASDFGQSHPFPSPNFPTSYSLYGGSFNGNSKPFYPTWTPNGFRHYNYPRFGGVATTYSRVKLEEDGSGLQFFPNTPYSYSYSGVKLENGSASTQTLQFFPNTPYSYSREKPDNGSALQFFSNTPYSRMKLENASASAQTLQLFPNTPIKLEDESDSVQTLQLFPTTNRHYKTKPEKSPEVESSIIDLTLKL